MFYCLLRNVFIEVCGQHWVLTVISYYLKDNLKYQDGL